MTPLERLIIGKMVLTFAVLVGVPLFELWSLRRIRRRQNQLRGRRVSGGKGEGRGGRGGRWGGGRL